MNLKPGKVVVGVLIGVVLTLPVQARFVDELDAPLWAGRSIEKVEERGIMTGFGDGTFRPKKVLNRVEALVIILRTKGINFKDSSAATNQFSDVPRDAWFASAVTEATDRSWIQGFPDGTFRPGQGINRAEWATLITRAFELTPGDEYPDFNDVPSQVWFSDPVFALYKNNLIRHYRSKRFQPGRDIIRADAAWVIAQILEKPRLMGTSKQYDYSLARRVSSRRVAIKPRDFNPNKQGYDIERKELKISTNADTEPVLIRGDSGWTSFGSVRIKNKLDDPVQLHSIEFKLKFERTNVGPPGSFQAQLRGIGFAYEQKVARTGSVFFGGLKMRLEPGSEIVLRLKLRPNENETFYMNAGEGVFWIFEASGSTIGTFKRENPERTGSYRYAPVKFESRNLSPVRFEP